MPNRHHGPPKRRLPMTWHAHNNHTPPLHTQPLLRHRDSAAPTGGFYYHRRPTTACRRRVTPLWSQFPPRTHPQPPLRPVQTPIAYDLARTQQSHATPARPSAAPPPRLGHANGGFTTIDAPPRRVAGVSQPYGRNSPHAPTHNRQPRARATTQHPAHPAPRPYTTSPPQHSQTPPRLGHANGGFYYHRCPATACRRRVAALWSQFPPHA